MCESVIGVPGGKPLRLTTNVAFAAVMLFELSRVMSNVTVTLPLPVASAPAMGGFSFDVNMTAENVGFGCDGEDGEAVQADARHASATARTAADFIGDSSLLE